MKIDFYEILNFLINSEEINKKEKFEIHNFELDGFSSLLESEENTITWFKGQEIDFDKVKAKIIIGPKTYSNSEKYQDKIFFLVNSPRKVFFQLLDKFYNKKNKYGIENTAILSENCKIHETVYIGHNVVIGNNVSIGENTVIYSNVIIYDNTSIGNNCIIHSGAVIGSDGFGFEKLENGEILKIQHIGGVIIKDNVEIGANTCIDRGTLGNTIIYENVKIDNLCHIAHNCVIGKNTFIIALSMIGGSTVIDNDCWVSPSASIRDGLVIKKGALVGMGAVVVKNVDINDIVAGVPARSLKKQ